MDNTVNFAVFFSNENAFEVWANFDVTILKILSCISITLLPVSNFLEKHFFTFDVNLFDYFQEKYDDYIIPILGVMAVFGLLAPSKRGFHGQNIH